MSVEKPTNMAASVRAKLKNVADRDGVDFQHRATRDLDLLAFGASDVDTVVETFKAIVGTEVEADGLVFDAAQTRGAPIKEGQKYRGVRLHLQAALGNARVPVQVDVGFGDAVEPDEGEYPTLIGLPAPRLRLYSRETVVAEKLHAMVVLGLLNGRLKDYYDVWYLSSTSPFEAERLGRAIARTFAVRDTPLPTTLPEAMTAAFLEVPGKPQMWSGFVRKAALPASTPMLADIITAVADFAWPIIDAEAKGERPSALWTPAEGWARTKIK